MKRSIRDVRVAVLVLLALIANAALVFAYVYHEPWLGGNIVMHLQLGSPRQPLIDGSTSWSTPVIAAMGEWNRYLPPGSVQFRLVNNSPQRIACENRINNVYWSSTLCGRDYGDHSGYTGWWVRSGYVVETDVVFNPKTDFAWNSYRGPVRHLTPTRILFDLRRIALHELGHVLGLDHPFDYGQRVRAIMNYNLAVESVQRDDINGIEELYRREKFIGSFRGSGTISAVTSSGRGTCTWTVTFVGASRDSIIARLKRNRDGTVAGTARVSGTWSTPAGRPSIAGETCHAGSGTFDDEQPVSGTSANLSWQTGMDLGLGTFTGRWFVAESYVAGTIVMRYGRGSGSISIPVRLTLAP